jgi:hypothetical protein
MSDCTLLPKNVNVAKLKYSEVKTLSNGSKTVYINYGSDKLTIQTPLMTIPYSMGDGTYNKPDAKEKPADPAEKKDLRFDLSLSFRGMEDNPKVQQFHDKLKEIERTIKDAAFANRLTWLRDDFDGMKAFTDKMFTPFIRYMKDKDTGKVVETQPPTVKVKLPYDNNSNTFVFDAYDMDEEEIDFKSIMTKLKGAKAQLVIQLSGIWFAGGKYGCTWKVLMGKFQLPRKGKITFIEDSDDEDATTKSTPKFEDDAELEEDAIAMTPAVVVDDEDDDDTSAPPPPSSQMEKVTLGESDEEDDDDMPPPPPKKGAAAKKTKK